MESVARNSNITIKETLKSDTFQFDFHQAVELLEQMTPNAVPLGEGVFPSKEAVRIKSRVSMSPSSSEIHSFSLPTANQNQPVLWINFMGIAGIQGPLPNPYTELLLERTSQHDNGFRDFLDIFNHRYASIWHRLKKRTFISYSQKDPTKTHVGKCLLSICGLGNESFRNKVRVSDRTILSYHDVLWRRPRSAHGLVKVLSTHFNMPVEIHQYQGGWERAPESEITKLGRRMNALGTEVILGDKVWNQSAGIRIDMGPMNWKQISQFMPTKIKNDNNEIITGQYYEALRDLTLFYAGIDHNIKFRFKVQSYNIKPLRLNRKFSLGHNSWITVGKPLEKPCFVDIVCRDTIA